MNLASKYRPTTFDDFVGSPLTVAMLKKMVGMKSLPPCLILSGKHGCGKTSIARILSRSLNSSDVEGLTYVEIDAASHSGVEDIRQLKENLRYNHPGDWRVVVLDEAHRLSLAAFNALLKDLEDPPARTSYVLATTQPENLPDTIHSRAMTFRVNPIPLPDIARRLIHIIKAEGLDVTDPKVVMRIAEVADGSLRNAVVLLEQVTFAEEKTVGTVNTLSGNSVDTQDLMYALASGKLSEVADELFLILNTNTETSTILESLSRDLKKCKDTNTISSHAFLRGMDVIWSMRRINASTSERSKRVQLEAGVYALFTQCFWDGKEEEASDVPKVKDIRDLEESTL